MSLNGSLKILLKSKTVKKAALDKSFLKPQLAMLTEEIPSEKSWIFESKFDGYRIFAIKNKDHYMLMSRNGLDWTKRFPNIEKALKEVRAESFVLDGEIVALDDKGISSFSELQKKLSLQAKDSFIFYAFDILYADAFDLRKLPLLGRKKILEYLLENVAKSKNSEIKVSEYVREDGKEYFNQACAHKTEGIIAKNIASPYQHKRSPDWLKIKCHNEDEFVIGGYTDPAGSRKYFGSLLVGYYDSAGSFIYAGKVGTGFDEKLLLGLFNKLVPLETKKQFFANPLSSLEKRNAHFVVPKLVAQVSYTEWTHDDRLRHPVFLGLREDKAAKDVRNPTLKMN